MKRAKQQLKPRNPLVAAAKFRKAGAHGKSKKAMRRKARIEAAKLDVSGED
jgi:hypothetical protein